MGTSLYLKQVLVENTDGVQYCDAFGTDVNYSPLSESLSIPGHTETVTLVKLGDLAMPVIKVTAGVRREPAGLDLRAGAGARRGGLARRPEAELDGPHLADQRARRSSRSAIPPGFDARLEEDRVRRCAVDRRRDPAAGRGRGAFRDGARRLRRPRCQLHRHRLPDVRRVPVPRRCSMCAARSSPRSISSARSRRASSSPTTSR